MFILYGLTAGVSIGQLYIAGIVPGLMLAALYIAYIIVRAKLDPSIAPRALSTEAALPIGEKLALLRKLLLPSLVVFAVLGSLYLGWATPTEAGRCRRRGFGGPRQAQARLARRALRDHRDDAHDRHALLRCSSARRP